MFFVRLYRLVPMLAVLLVTSIVIYVFVSMRSTRPQAKSAVLKFFTWSFVVTTVVFALATLYALLEKNTQVTELMGSFAIACLIFLVITRICYRVFISHYPNFAEKPTRARIVHWWEELVRAIRHWWRVQRGEEAEEDEPPVDVKGE